MYFIRIKQPGSVALAEIKALCAAYGARIIKTYRAQGFVFIDKKIPFSRLAFSKHACRLIRLPAHFKSFKIIGTPEQINALAPKISGRVNLSRPQTIIRIARTGAQLSAGAQEWVFSQSDFERPGFEKKHVTLRPELARLAVNLAMVKRGQRVLDPFCGTGAILFEAKKFGAVVFGSDADSAMIEVCRRNLQRKKNIMTADIANLAASQNFDAVVTDFPYGRGSSLHGRMKKLLYGLALEKIALALKPGGRAVVISNEKLGPEFLAQNKVLSMRVHSSLVRYLHVFFQKEVKIVAKKTKKKKKR